MELHDYQQEAVTALYERDRLVLRAVMGAGKTAIGATLMSELLAEGVVDHFWVLAPKRVAQLVWPDELTLWAPHLTHHVVTAENKQNIPPAQVYIANFEIINSLPEMTGGVLIDELSRFKNPQSKRRRRFKQLAQDARLIYGMTGTLMSNGEMDLWAQIDAVHGPVWGRSFYTWRAQNFIALDNRGYRWSCIDPEGIARALAPLVHNVEIPPASVPVYLEDPVSIPMEIYDELKDELVLVLEHETIFADQAAQLVMKLRQICAGFLYTDGDPVRVNTAKLDALEEIAEDSGENLLVFYQFREELDMLRERFPHVAVIGEGDDTDTVARWNEGKLPMLACHPASAGHGLNLQRGGRRIVWMSLTWSLEEYDQANARLARQGQTETVYVHHLLARGTIDRVVLRALRGKRRVADFIVENLDVGQVAAP